MQRALVAAALIGAARNASAQAVPLEVTITDNVRELKPPSREPTAAGSVISRDRLQAPLLQAQDALRTQPGLIVTETGGVASPATATMRGASAADTPIYLAGVRLNDEVGGSADLSMIPLWLLQRVEIYRSHAPIEADRFQPGGAIFFEPIVPQKTQAGVGTSVGSWGSSAVHAYAGSKTQRVAYLVGVGATQASNRYPYQSNAGLGLSHGEIQTKTRENADAKRLDGWAIGRYTFGDGAQVQVLANVVEREHGVPRLAILPSERARQQSTRQLVALSARVPLPFENASLDTQTSVVLNHEDYDDPLGELSLRTPQLTVSGQRVEQSVSARLDLPAGFRLRPMLSLAHETLERTPSEASFTRARRLSSRMALRAEAQPSDRWSVHTLVAGECHLTDASSDCTPEFTGRLGGEVRLGELRFYSTAGRYVRIPTLGELYGVSGTVHGNRELTSETGLTAEVGVRAETEIGAILRRAYLDAFAFVRDADHLIAYTPTAQAFIRPYNVGKARVKGLEALTGVEALGLLQLEAALMLLDPRNRTPDRSVVNDLLPYRSRLIFSPRARFVWRRHSHQGVSSFDAELSALYQSSRYADAAGLGLIDAQTSIDMAASLGWFDDLLHLRVRVADLLDQRRTDLVGYPLPQRSVYLGLDAQF